MKEKYDNLQSEVYDLLKESKSKMGKYDKKVRVSNMALLLLNPISAVLIFASFFMTNGEVYVKAVGLGISVLSVVISYIAQNENYGGKLIQRGTTYFALCNLYRKMKYAEKTKETYMEFADEFEKIMENDNNMSLSNTIALAGYLQNTYQNGLKQEKYLKNLKEIDEK